MFPRKVEKSPKCHNSVISFYYTAEKYRSSGFQICITLIVYKWKWHGYIQVNEAGGAKIGFVSKIGLHQNNQKWVLFLKLDKNPYMEP